MVGYIVVGCSCVNMCHFFCGRVRVGQSIGSLWYSWTAYVCRHRCSRWMCLFCNYAEWNGLARARPLDVRQFLGHNPIHDFTSARNTISIYYSDSHCVNYAHTNHRAMHFKNGIVWLVCLLSDACILRYSLDKSTNIHLVYFIHCYGHGSQKYQKYHVTYNFTICIGGDCRLRLFQVDSTTPVKTHHRQHISHV